MSAATAGLDLSRTSATPRPAHRLDIQGLRGVAVLLVVLFHAGIGPRAGFVGVDVFFVISGFVIGRRLAEELDETDTVGLGAFYGRRIRRLLPAMAIFTVVTAIATAAVLSPFGPQQFSLRTGAAATVFAANVHLYRHTGYFDGAADMNPFLHTWSLSVEEQFFLVLPAMLAGIWWLARRVTPGRSMRAVTTAAVATLTAASLVVCWLLTSDRASFGLEAPERVAFFAMPTRIWQFGAGVLMALSWERIVRLGARHVLAAAAVGVCGLLSVLIAATLLDPLAAHPGRWAMVVVAGTCGVLGTGVRGSPAARVLSIRPLVALGDVSYGWYLWHWPMIVFAGVLWPNDSTVIVVVAAAALVPAVLSHRFVERPIMRGSGWSARRTASLGLLCIVAPLVVIGALLWGSSAGWGLDEPMGWYDYPPSDGTACHIVNRAAVNVFPGDDCVFGGSPAGVHVGGADLTNGDVVMVLGDESANSATTAVVDAATSTGMETMHWSRSGCPFLIGAVPVSYPKCAEWQRAALRLVAQSQPALVVIANQAPNYTSSTDGPTVLAAEDGSRPASPGAAVEAWRRGLDRTLDQLDKMQIPAIVVGAIPDFEDDFPRTRISPLNPSPKIPELDTAEVQRTGAAALSVERSVVDQHPNVRLLDPIPRLCSTVCRPVEQGSWSYLRADELTNSGSRKLGEPVIDLMGELLQGRP